MATKKAKKTPSKVKKSWHGRLTAEADAETAALLTSLDVDQTLWRYDIVASLAHAQMLCEQKLITRAASTRTARRSSLSKGTNRLALSAKD